MRRLVIVGAALAALTLSACGESTAKIDANRILVADEDGKVDLRQIKDACESLGMQVDSWSTTALNLGDGEALTVTCR